MTPNEADHLAIRIRDGWPGRSAISHDVLVGELEPLDAGRAGTAVVRMLRTLEHPPTIARLLAEYRAVEGDPKPRVDCVRCEGNGWLDAPEERRHTRMCTPAFRAERAERGLGDCGCHAVTPCNCEAGEQARRIESRIRG